MQQAAQQTSPLSAPVQNRQEAEQIIFALEKTLDSLSLVLSKETELAKLGKMRQAIDVQIEKAKLTEIFLKTGERFRSNTKYFRAEMPQACEKIQKLHERFCDEVTRNMRALATTKAISESLIQEIIDTAREHDNPAGYTAAGVAMNGKTNTAPPLRVNRSF
ncbi:MAG: hypothetical protein V4691_05305 [Pseudomonadota bacterium]